MLKISETSDVQYLASIITEPSMWRRLNDGVRVTGDYMSSFKDTRNRFFGVLDNKTPKGFVAFQYIAPGFYAIHTALLTIGDRTRYAFCSAIRQLNADILIAAFPDRHRAAHQICLDTGWQRLDPLFGAKFYLPYLDGPIAYYILTKD